ncbi:MAG: NlpC/P60 family protein [Hyphomicrobiales bacterium]|nr:NlpC/P60 family protein [Hyphomicrobiales bacterium]
MTARPLPTRDAIVAVARRWIGTPYRHRASLEGVGCDCLGLVRGVWREFYGDEPESLPAYAPDWAEAGRAETLLAAGARHLVAVPVDLARPGDVVLFRWRPELPAKHAGILTAPTRFVHAYDGSAVVESPLGAWWRRRLAAAFAFPGVPDAAGASTDPSE